MRVKTETAGKTKDVDVTAVTPDNYIVPDSEKGLYHCIIEVKKFDAETGKRLSIPRIQIFGKKAFENGVQHNLSLQGFTVTILHDPNEYLKAQSDEDKKAAIIKAEKLAKAKEEAETKAVEEQQSSIKAAVDAALKAKEEETQKSIDKAVAEALAKAKAVDAKK